jgi:hypothetical protein
LTCDPLDSQHRKLKNDPMPVRDEETHTRATNFLQ